MSGAYLNIADILVPGPSSQALNPSLARLTPRPESLVLKQILATQLLVYVIRKASETRYWNGPFLTLSLRNYHIKQVHRP